MKLYNGLVILDDCRNVKLHAKPFDNLYTEEADIIYDWKKTYLYLPTIIHGNHNITTVNINEYLSNTYTFILNM